MPTIIPVPTKACFSPPLGMLAGNAVCANRLTEIAATPRRTTR